VISLTELAHRDTLLLKEASTGDWLEPSARDLLLEAAQECG